MRRIPRGLMAIGAVLILAVLVVGCADRVGPDGPTDEQRARSELNNLARSFEDASAGRIGDLLHSDYDDGARYRNDVRSALSETFRRFDQIDLDFHALRANRDDEYVDVTTNWNLRWRDDNDPNDSVELCRGETTFRFLAEDSRWRLLSQSGDPILAYPGDMVSCP